MNRELVGVGTGALMDKFSSSKSLKLVTELSLVVEDVELVEIVSGGGNADDGEVEDETDLFLSLLEVAELLELMEVVNCSGGCSSTPIRDLDLVLLSTFFILLPSKLALLVSVELELLSLMDELYELSDDEFEMVRDKPLELVLVSMEFVSIVEFIFV